MTDRRDGWRRSTGLSSVKLLNCIDSPSIDLGVELRFLQRLPALSGRPGSIAASSLFATIVGRTFSPCSSYETGGTRSYFFLPPSTLKYTKCFKGSHTFRIASLLSDISEIFLRPIFKPLFQRTAVKARIRTSFYP